MTTTPQDGIYLKVAGQRLFVRIAGKGLPVLLLHGGGPGTSGEGWRELMAQLAPGLQVYAPDFLGFGYSDAPEGVAYGTEKCVADMLELMDLLCLDKVALVGHSMGAMVAATLAVQHPGRFRHLVLVGPGGNSYGLTYKSPGIEQIEKVADDPSEANLRELVAMMSARPELYEAELEKRQALIARPGLMDVQRTLKSGRKQRTNNGLSMGERVRALSLPMALLWGSEEVFNPNDLGPKIHAALPPQATYHLIEGAGHNIHYDQPERVAQVLKELLTG